MSPKARCKELGCKSLVQVIEQSHVPERTLRDWFISRSFVFDSVCEKVANETNGYPTSNEAITRALAALCSAEMKEAGIDNMPAHKLILDRYEQQLSHIGVSRTEFMVMIGRHNGSLKERK